MKNFTRGGLVVLAFAGLWAACGGSTINGEVGAAGGEVCLPDGRACIKVPLGGLEKQELIRIAPGGERPPAALGESYDISSVSGKELSFLKSATVTISLETIDTAVLDALPSENLLRIYTKEGNDWVPLEKSQVDRVRNVVRGETKHLSPFVVLRTDRLPDGGLPIEMDAGVPDGSVIVIPPFDGGRPDAGRPDAGMPDAGPPDAGPPDAGPPDAGPPDAGPPDAGPPDAGLPDAGPPDAGTPDAGTDAGMADAGGPDAGTPDAGDPDAGDPDAGGTDAGEPDAGDGG